MEKISSFYHPPVDGPLPRRIAVLESDFIRGTIYNRITRPTRSNDELMPSPLGYPLFEILMICLLSQGRGLMVHACGVIDCGKGYLFAGNSTHGKTTMARLWRNCGIILNDDRIILRHRDGRFWMYGTPFHGEYSRVSSQGVPLDKIFFLSHAETNEINLRKGATASSMLLARSFLPLWDSVGISYTLEFCGQLVTDIPCYELGFVPNHNIVDFVRCVR